MCGVQHNKCARASRTCKEHVPRARLFLMWRYVVSSDVKGVPWGHGDTVPPDVKGNTPRGSVLKGRNFFFFAKDSP